MAVWTAAAEEQVSPCSSWGAQRSLAALYVRRGVAQEFGSRAGAVTLNKAPCHKHAGVGDKHLLHEQFLFAHGCAVPDPQRGGWVRRERALDFAERPGHLGQIETDLQEAR